MHTCDLGCSPTGWAEGLTFPGTSWIPGWGWGGDPGGGGGLGPGPGQAVVLEPDLRVNATIHTFPFWGLGPESRKHRCLIDALGPRDLAPAKTALREHWTTGYPGRGLDEEPGALLPEA